MSSLSKNSPTGQNYASWFIFGLMASVTFVGILSELVPSGILPQMTEGLGIYPLVPCSKLRCASRKNGEYLFKKPEPSYNIELDLFRKTR